MLGSLSRLSKFTYYLGLISEEIQHDMVKLSKVRNEYAHNHTTSQLDDEDKLFKYISDTYLYRKNINLFEGVSRQNIFKCIKDQLIKYVKSINIKNT